MNENKSEKEKKSNIEKQYQNGLTSLISPCINPNNIHNSQIKSKQERR